VARAREVLPRRLSLIGSTPADLGTALRHEASAHYSDPAVDRLILRQLGQHEQLPLIHAQQWMPPRPLRERERWFVVLIDLLVAPGADEDVTVAAVDRLADLLPATYVGWWEWAARLDPILARLGLSPDQSGALSRSWPAPDATGTMASATACWPPHAPPVIVTSALPCLLHSRDASHPTYARTAGGSPDQALPPVAERAIAGRPAVTG